MAIQIARTSCLAALAITLMGAAFVTGDDQPNAAKQPKREDAKSPTTTLPQATQAEVDRTLSKAGIISPAENDQRILRWLSVDNKVLLECSQMAAKQSQNDEIKKFANEVQSAHQALEPSDVQDSKKSADKAGTSTDANRTAVLLKDDGASRAGAAVYMPTDFVAVKEKVSDKMMSKAKKEMSALKGAEFDHAFVAHMVFAHEALIATIDALDGEASQGIQSRLTALRETSQKHLDEARNLQKRLRSESNITRASATETTTK